MVIKANESHSIQINSHLSFRVNNHFMKSCQWFDGIKKTHRMADDILNMYWLSNLCNCMLSVVGKEPQQLWEI
jgi:hypothetical protein